ncbi:uncharacterized protein LOC114935454 isoform X2 [Nylanderia fulva]|nr:uncharacterized protein LOC114935454 isoform X2 [Nylanderia fulva]XP_029164130.1 uncharacterized protein LOC114935454 isoform X2 [Nylanderia fulva]XP_029164131.1 uncharacterized protein LOC114935454 isoform X2 [Nylanderia fulva]XP_029164132.1 uncharacterized protein LOC114935454 isoform X2 [Nylanderia fulva]
MSRQHYYVAQKYSANLSCLSCGEYQIRFLKVFPAQAAIYWAEKGRRVVYISPTPLENRPAVCHDRSDPTVAALDLMRFIYLPDYETLIEQLVKLHMYAAVPSVLLIDDLDNYFTDETIKNDSFVHIARTCALIIHSMKSCSRILKMNVYVCAWTNSILTNNFLQTIYFRNIWNLTEEDEKIILLEKFAIGLSSKQSYKYHKFKDGMRVLQQICHSIEA